MRVLGLSCYYHDSAAALLEDGLLVAAAEEERFTRRKHDFGFPYRAIAFCLDQAGIAGRDLDYAVFYEKPVLKFQRILLTALQTFPRSWVSFRVSMISWLNEKLWVKSQIARTLGLTPDRILFVEHHLSHAASTLFCAPFEEAAILTVDGVGEWATATIGRGVGDWQGSQSRIDVLEEIHFPHSLGLLYSAFTAYLGFEVNEGEYKVMGLAAYGQPRYIDKVTQVAQVANDGSLHLDMRYFTFHVSTRQSYNSRFVDLFGAPRSADAEFFTPQTDPQRAGPTAEENQRFADIAASIQRFTEEAMIRMARWAYRRTGLTRLCLAGGVALNSVANGRILRETPFQEVFIQPAAGDSGGALGAALYAYHVLLGRPRRFTMEHAYWGVAFPDREIEATLRRNGLSFREAGSHDEVMDRTVQALVRGEVVGWFQGRGEWGPRALGNRSILADPRDKAMQEVVNLKIKFREPFRPFAPVVLEEAADKYFQPANLTRSYPARFMLLVTDITPEQRAVIPAVTHVDGTGRLQTVRREWNPAYYGVVQRFGEATGVPVLLNTSFNLRGEPIVNAPDDAIRTFLKSDLDVLMAGPFEVRKA